MQQGTEAGRTVNLSEFSQVVVLASDNTWTKDRPSAFGTYRNLTRAQVIFGIRGDGSIAVVKNRWGGIGEVAA